VEGDATRALEVLIGLPEVVFLGLEVGAGGELRVHVEGRSARVFCESCGIAAQVKERPVVSLIDLPVYARPEPPRLAQAPLLLPDDACPRLSWTEETLASALRA